MASTSNSNERLVGSINEHILRFLEDPRGACKCTIGIRADGGLGELSSLAGPNEFGFWLKQSRDDFHVSTPPLEHLSSPLIFYLSHETNISQTSSMASTSNSNERLDLESIRVLVGSINEHILRFLEDPKSRKSVQLRCTAKLRIQKHEFFEFSEQSVVSNLYWGIESVEAAIQAKWPEERTARLKSAEQMLQAPALSDEHGSTGGIQNRYLVCCSYFYLSLVRKLEMDEWQVTLHFLQAMLVYPWLVRMEFTPELWKSVFLPKIMRGWKGLQNESCLDYCSSEVDEVTRQIARRYKDWLMYYRITLFGESPKWNRGVGATSALDGESQYSMCRTSANGKTMDLVEPGKIWPKFQDGEKVHPLDIQDRKCFLEKLDEVADDRDGKEDLNMKCLLDMLKDSQSDTSISTYAANDSKDGSDLEEKMDNSESFSEIQTAEPEKARSESSHRKLQHMHISNPENRQLILPEATAHRVENKSYEVNTSYYFSSNFFSSTGDVNQQILELRNTGTNTSSDRHVEGLTPRRSDRQSFRLIDYMKNYSGTHMNNQQSLTRKSQDSNSRRNLDEISLDTEKDQQNEAIETFKKSISMLRFSDKAGKFQDVIGEVSIMWEVLSTKTEPRYGLLKDEILDQLLTAISASQEERVIRASVSVLITIVLKNKTVVEDIKKKGLRLCDLVSALKRNVHEAAVLIYLINPSSAEVKSLELLPALLDVACNSNIVPIPRQLTPHAASLMMIEVLVTAFDNTTTSTHLAAISSPPVLSRLLDAARDKNLGEIISLTSILTKCMQFDAQSKRHLSVSAPMNPIVRLLRSKEKHAQITALQFFHEILCMPRSSATSLLHQIRQPDNINVMHTLMSCIQNLDLEYQILASNLLLQLDMMEEPSGVSIYREEAMEILLEAIASEKSSEAQTLSASILSNIGGTYAWTGESYTAAWLVQKAGLTSPYHKNMLRNFNWSDQSLQDIKIDEWCSRAARSIIKIGSPVFHALRKGLQSSIKSVSSDCLIAVAWIGYEIAKTSPSDLRYSACETLLSGVEQFLHPGIELEERLLASLSVYNYVSGKGMKKLSHFSEGVQESLRRLSSVSWMAEELVKVTEYLVPTKSRISCVHTQILEMGHNCGGAASALIYYKGQLYSGHSDGTIKVWDIKEQTAILVWNVKEHKKAVTCFTLSEPGDSLLSGSTDKTIRVWQMVRRRLECVEVIKTKEPVHQLNSYDQYIFALTHKRGVKVFNSSRTIKCICKRKHVKCATVVQGKLYLGCTDSSIQEVDIKTEQQKEIKAPTKSWWRHNKPIISVLAFKEWLYNASVIVEGSPIKERRKGNKPQMSISVGKGSKVQAMGVVEDFIYLNCSSSPNIIEIWLRETQRKVGRLAAGSKITSFLTANDIVLCGTETGLIKGWIPL